MHAISERIREKRPDSRSEQRPSTRLVCRVGLAATMLVFIVAFIRLTFTLYDHFAYMSFDLGIFNQAVWLIAHGRTPFVTLRGVHTMGDHFNLFLYLLALPYRLYPTPKTLLFLQTVALALGAIPAYALARKRLDSEPLGLLFGIVYLLYPAHQWSLTYEFHPDTFATPFVLTALYALDAKRWPLYTLALLLTSLLKESAGLAILALGGWALCRGIRFETLQRRRQAKKMRPGSASGANITEKEAALFRKIGIATIVFGGGMMLLAMRTVAAYNYGQPSVYFDIFAHYGDSPTAMLHHLASHPVPFLADVFQHGNLFYFGLLLAPLCFLPLLSPEMLLCSLPLLLVNFMSERAGMHSIEEYYNAFLTPFLLLGAIIGFDRVQRWGGFARWTVRLLLPVWALSSLLIGPLVRPVDTIYSAQPPMVALHECEEAISMIPTDTSVSTQMAPGSHLSSRVNCYAFPNPFVRAAWGNTHPALYEIGSITGTRLPNDIAAAVNSPVALQRAEFVLLCPRSNPFPLTEMTTTRLMVALLQSRNYETLYVGHFVMLLRRVPAHGARLQKLAESSGRSVVTSEAIESTYWHWLTAQYPASSGKRP